MILRRYCILRTVVYRLPCIPAFFWCVDFSFATRRARPRCAKNWEYHARKFLLQRKHLLVHNLYRPIASKHTDDPPKTAAAGELLAWTILTTS